MIRFFSSCVVSCLLVAGLLAGCSHSLLQSGADNYQAELHWQGYESDTAQEFIDECKAQLERAGIYLQAVSESRSEIPDLALLNQLNQLQVVLDRVGGRSELYQSVHPQADVRAASGLCLRHVHALSAQLTLSQEVYRRLRRVDAEALGPPDRAYWHKLKQSAERAGVNKSKKNRQRIRALNDQILALGQTYRRVLREDVKTVDVDPTLLTGLPRDFIDAHPVNQQGLVTLTTNRTDYEPVMQYAHSEKLRKKLYQQFRSRGYPENEAVLEQLLLKRHELAQLLGFDNFAQYLTADKMIASEESAEDFIEKVDAIAAPRAEQDYRALLQRLQQIEPAANEVEEWQRAYLEHLIRSEIYQADARRLRRYFPYGKVKAGIFGLAGDLFGVNIKPWDTEVWHPSVEAYELWDGEQLLGQFYLDMHPREGKYQHAAHFGVREGVAGVQTPISALVANFPGGGDDPGLMEHQQVERFVHDFGHLLHHMFAGQQPWLALAGIGTERDFVEAPSQMLEEWVWHGETLKTFAINEEGETIPDAMIENMIGARSFGRGIYTRQQMFYAALALHFHNQDPQKLDLQQTVKRLQERYSPFNRTEGTHFHANFRHLESYSALYYAYMWSQVIAADLFSEFEEVGLRNQDVAARYRQTVLAPGGAKPAAQLVEDFLGRPFSFDAFARQLGESH